MYKKQARFLKRNPGYRDGMVERAAMDGSQGAFKVVWFFPRQDNRRRLRIFRRAEFFTALANAKDCYRRIKILSVFKVFLRGTEIVESEGDPTLMDQWTQARRGLNEGSDPLLSPRYGDKETRASVQARLRKA